MNRTNTKVPAGFVALRVPVNGGLKLGDIMFPHGNPLKGMCVGTVMGQWQPVSQWRQTGIDYLYARPRTLK